MIKMGKLNLVIIDRDADYVNCLLDYLMAEQAHKFIVSAYTEETALVRFLAEESAKAKYDIFLVSEEFYEQVMHKVKGMVILLAAQEVNFNPKNKDRVIYKYQYGDKLVEEILEKFAEECSVGDTFNPIYISNVSQQKNRIIGIYSPIGGVGKTTIAVGACIQSAWEGKSVFYLNLENIATTPLYFQGEQEKNLSNVLYFLKSKSANLSLQIESVKCVDPLYKVHYFQPPDSIYDFTEDVSHELCHLLQELKTTMQYERIFIDFSSAINKNNLAVLRNCDVLLLVAEENPTSVVKIKNMLKELHLLLSKEEKAELINKFNLVLNKVLPAVEVKTEGLNINQKV